MWWRSLWLIVIATGVLCAFCPSPPAAADDCGLYCNTVDDNEDIPGLMVGYWGGDKNCVVARKFTLANEADIEQIGFYCQRISYHNPGEAMSINIFKADGPPYAVFRGGGTDSSWIGESPGWYYCPNVHAYAMPAGTYWLMMMVEPGGGRFQVRWIGSKTNQCGANDDNLMGTYDAEHSVWKDWMSVGYECAYELVCADCPSLSGASVTSTEEIVDNKWRYYDYEVTYKNPAGVLPSVAKVKFNASPCDTWCDMARVDDKSPVTGTKYRKHFGGRLGVGDEASHTWTMQFDTPGGRSITRSGPGPKVPGCKPVVNSATFSPCVLKVNEVVSFTSDCTDADSGNNITNYRWVFEKPGKTVTINTTSPLFSKYGSDIGTGNWKVSLTVTDDETPGINSDKYLCNCTGYPSVTELQVLAMEAPVLGDITASVDGFGTNNDGAVGVFVTGVGKTVNNKFTATVTDPENDIDHVDFRLLNSGITVTDSEGPTYEATFDMGSLTGAEFLQVQAFDKATPVNGSEIKYVVIHTVGPPDWWNSWWAYEKSVSYDSGLKEYTFRCKVPQLLVDDDPPTYVKLDYTADISTGTLFGDIENHLISRIDIMETFSVAGHNNNKEYWTYWGEGLMDATFLSQQLYRQTFPLEHPTEVGEINPEYRRNVQYYVIPIFSKNLYEKTIEGPSYDYRGIIMAGPVPVEYHAGMSTEIGFSVDFSITGRLNSALGLVSMAYTPSPKFSVTFDAFIEIYEGLAKLGFRAEPTFCCDLPLILHMPDPQHTDLYFQFEPCLQFWVNYTVYGSVGWGLLKGDLYTGKYPDPAWKYGWPIANCTPINCGDGAAGRAQPSGSDFLFASPTIASDKEGTSSICVWIHDSDATGDVNPELYYSYYPNNFNTWSAPAPVFLANNQRFETDPKVIYTDLKKIMLVWTQNTLDKNTMAGKTFVNDVTKEQELYYIAGTYTAGKTIQWDPAGAKKLTDDTLQAKNPQWPAHHGDGLVSLGANQASGKAIAAWVRENYVFQPGVTRNETTYNPTWDIYAATFDGANWSNPFVLSPGGDNTADAQPDVAMNTNGDAMVAWARDMDGDFTTNGDRFIARRNYTANPPGWGGMVFENTWPSGALSPAVAYDNANTAIVLFNKRGNNSKGQPIQEGPDERLWSACFSNNPPVVAPVGGGDGPRCMEPKVRCDVQNQTVAIWRGFPAEGKHGYNGQVAMNLRYAGMPTCTNWGGTAFLTSDTTTKWQADFDVDMSDMIRVVYVKKDVSVPMPLFGQGYDGIYLLEMGRGPDLLVDSVSFDKERPLPGEQVTITATIRNGGNRRAFGFNVDFIADTQLIGQQNVGQLVGQGSVDLQQSWISDGLPHMILIVADSTNVVTETNEGNNTAFKNIGRIPPPENLTAYGDSVSGGIELAWNHPGADHFNVYRAESPGGGRTALGSTQYMHFLDMTCVLNHDYYYVVTAADATQESDPSNEVLANIGIDYDEDGIPDISDPDDDNDGMSDDCEIAYGFDPHNPADGSDDADSDNFTNAQECQAGTDPRDPDSHPDTVPPTTPIVSAERYATSTTELGAWWTCSDSYSGIGEYRYAIGTSAGSTETRTWTSNETYNELVAEGLSLENGKTYYVAVRAFDVAGNESSTGISHGTKVDTSAPVITGPTTQSWTPETSLAASWYAEDEQSQISGFEYSVGPSAGATDIVGWTDVGLALGVLRTDMDLGNGQVCYVNVRATNGAGLQATASAGPIRAVKVPGSIAAALGLSDELWVVLTGKTVTGVVLPYAWIEETDRSAAVRLLTGLALAVGQNVTVVGQMQTPVYTRQIVTEDADVESAGNPARSLGMRNASVGGSARNVLTRGVDGAVGLNNVCLLVTTWGEVTSAGTGYFYIDDGSGLLDGTGGRGIRVNSQGLTNPSVHSFAVVTGLVNASKLVPDATSIRLLIPRRQSDIRVIGGPGLPDNPATAAGVDTVNK